MTYVLVPPVTAYPYIGLPKHSFDMPFLTEAIQDSSDADMQRCLAKFITVYEHNEDYQQSEIHLMAQKIARQEDCDATIYSYSLKIASKMRAQ